MEIFSTDSRGVEVWGPTASIDVRVGALGRLSDSWVLTNISINAKEITDIRQCFGDVSYIYALGNDQRQCAASLTFAVFIGAKKCGSGNNTKALLSGFKSYDSGRISQNKQPSTIAIGNFSCLGWLTGINAGGVDAFRGICYCTVSFIMELPK